MAEMPEQPTKQAYEPPAVNKWMVAIAVMFGAFMAIMDISVVNVALPHMMGNFGQTLSAITWVATGYSIAAIIMLTMSGWWVTLLGRKRFYLLSFAVFTVGSILAGTAHSFTQMIIYRVLQGLGGGSLVPISQAILRETFPREEQGMAMAVFGMGVVLAPAFGPVLGGWLTDHYGWPWIFYINIPVSILGMLMVMLFVHDPVYLRRGVKHIDWQGIIFLAIGLTSLQIVLERGQEKNWLDSNFIIAGIVVAVISIVALIVQELRAKEPVINIRLLKNLQLGLGVSIIMLFGISLYGTTFILPQFTQQLLHYPALDAGLVLMPRAITLFLFMPLVGKLYNHFDPRVLVGAGILIVCASYTQLAHLSLLVSPGNIVPILLLMGSGFPFIFVSLSTVALSTTPKEDMTSATALFNLFQQVGGNLGYAIIATMLDRRIQLHTARLTENISIFNGNFQAFAHKMNAVLTYHGFNPAAAGKTVLAMASNLVTQQAGMMAYNDISIILLAMFIFSVPLLIFLRPSQEHGAPTRPAVAEM